MLEPLWISTLIVAVAEIGDKTQLLAILLAARFRKPVPILLGIFFATLLNHGMAAFLGAALGQWLEGAWFQFAVGVSFIVMAAWALIPDKADDGPQEAGAGSVFMTTAVAFFLVEIGDKTQVATALLAARFQDVFLVTVGTTLGMMAANAPAVLLGEAAARFAPLALVRTIAAGLFAVLGVWIIVAALL